MKNLFRISHIILYVCVLILPLVLMLPKSGNALTRAEAKDCFGYVDRYIKANNLDVPSNMRRRADRICLKGGKGQRAISALRKAKRRGRATKRQVSPHDQRSKIVGCYEAVNGFIDAKRLNVTREEKKRATKICDKEWKKRNVNQRAIRALSKGVGALKISSFQGSATKIRKGEQVKLWWEVFGADSVTIEGRSITGQINQNKVSVPLQGKKNFYPKRTTHYRMEVTKEGKTIEKVVTIQVSLLQRRMLHPFSKLEVCAKIDRRGGTFRCINPDGPFRRSNKKIEVLVTFHGDKVRSGLRKGNHKLQLIGYSKDLFGKGKRKWKRNFKQSRNFSSNGDEGVINVDIPNKGKNLRKLELTIDGKRNSKSYIEFCVECPDPDEG